MQETTLRVQRGLLILGTLVAGLLLGLAAIGWARAAAKTALAAPIPPPEGFPKLSLSAMVVSPTLANTGGATLEYVIELVNTGAYQADGVSFSNPIPASTVYQMDAEASTGSIGFAGEILTWTGSVGFDSRVTISYSVLVDSSFEGVVRNQAVVTQAQISAPITLSAETVVTDDPILVLSKAAFPLKPGPNKPLTFEVTITNVGQPANGLSLTITDSVPANTSLLNVGLDGIPGPGDDSAVWERTVDLPTGAESVFTFTVQVGDVASGTVVENSDYQLSSIYGVTVGPFFTTTVVDPILSISKDTIPDPPGSNREMIYVLTVLNTGSLATDLVVTDQIPPEVAYVSGGSQSGKLVSWQIPELETGERVEVSFTVKLPDIAGVIVTNTDFGVCSSERICQDGRPLESLVLGPTFEAEVFLDPVAKKPGAGTGPVTPTIVIHNLGPGAALDVRARLSFLRINVNETSDLLEVNDRGTFQSGPSCGDKCLVYDWIGDLAEGETVTFTTDMGQNTQVGDPGTVYSASVVITDSLDLTVTQPVTAEATGVVTHKANLIPSKTAPAEIGAGQVMTYVVRVYNSGLSTELPPAPFVTDTVPLSTTLVEVSPGGQSFTVGGRTVVSWTLPAFSPGDAVNQWFSVQVDPDLVSGTKIVNDDYWTRWFHLAGSEVYSNTSEPLTTTVKEIGLVDSFKTASPALLRPGKGNLITFTVNVVNSSPMLLQDVVVEDLFPWQNSTFLRNAGASAGEVISDIVSLQWTGDVGPFSQELITVTVLVDEDYEGPLTNTATIRHSTLLTDVVVEAVAYITNDPVLMLAKKASPDPVVLGRELLYTIFVTNLGQQATGLVLTDTIPAGSEYVTGSASSGGQLNGSMLRWEFPVLAVGQTRSFTFRVKAVQGSFLVNDLYRVSSAEGVEDWGEPVTTRIFVWRMFFPVIRRDP